MKPVSLVHLLPKERAELVLLSTFNFDPAFFERCLLPALRQARRVVIFVDAQQWAAQAPVRLRQVNRHYLVVPIRRSGGVFHPKLLLHLATTSATLICGSANLSKGGCNHNLELLNSFPFSFVAHANPSPEAAPDHLPPHAALLASALTFFRACAAAAPEALSRLVTGWLDELPLTLPWLPAVLAAPLAPESPRLQHSFEGSLWSAIREELAGRPPRVIRILSPYYDHDLALAARFRREWPACRLEITAQQHTSFLPTTAFAPLGPQVTLHELRGAGSRRLHAKLIAFEHARGTLFVTGSANFTTAAFDGRNVEACLLWHDREATFERLFTREFKRAPIAPEDFQPGEEPPPEESAPALGSSWQILSAVLTEEFRLQVEFTSPPTAGPLALQLFLQDHTEPELALPLASNARGSGLAQLTPAQAALLTGPTRCLLSVDSPTGPLTSRSTWVVQEAHLTRSSGEASEPGPGRDRLLHETGEGLLEILAELARTQGHAAMIEFLSRLSIRFVDTAAPARARPFHIRPHDPFHPDTPPQWSLEPALRSQYGQTALDFAHRHDKEIFRRHAKKPSLGGLENFQHVLLAVTRILAHAYAEGSISHRDFPLIVGPLCDAAAIFGLGLDGENKESPGYIAGLLENLAGHRAPLLEALHEHNTLGVVRVVLLTAQRIRHQLPLDDPRPPHPLSTPLEKYTRLLKALGCPPPPPEALERALERLDFLTPNQITLWLKTA